MSDETTRTDPYSGAVISGSGRVADRIEEAVARLEQAQLGLAAFDGQPLDDSRRAGLVFRLMQARERLDDAIETLL